MFYGEMKMNNSMVQYIDKAAVVAEIERIEYETNYEPFTDEVFGKRKVCKDIKDFLNTLEVKDVDLEKHLKEDIEDVFFDLDGVAVKGATHYITVEDVKYIAKNFFELGLKSKSSYVGIPNIDDTLKEMGVDPDSKEANTFKESFYNALEKFKAQKGE